LHNSASSERTSQAATQIENILSSTPGGKYTTSVIGFSLLSFVRTSYNAFFVVTLKPWDERTSRAEQFQAIKAHLNQQLSKLPAGIAFSFSPPAISGVGTAGGFTFNLEDRSGGSIQFLSKNVNTFLDAARRRPEIASLSTTFLPSVPEKFIDVDRDKVLKQDISLSDVYRTIQAFMGGYFINYFNRFGRQWQVYVEAETEDRASTENVGRFYVRNNKGENVPLATLATVKSQLRPEFTERFNEYRCAQINGSAAPGYSADQATAALEEVFKQTMPREMGFDYSGISFLEQKARQVVVLTLVSDVATDYFTLLQRAFRRSDLFRGKIFGSVLAMLALAFSGFFLYGIFIGARHVLPASHGAPQVGQTAPDFTLPDSQNHPVSLTGALNSPFTPESTTRAATSAAKAAGVILIFYRGYW